jgi:hypothetical protein
VCKGIHILLEEEGREDDVWHEWLHESKEEESKEDEASVSSHSSNSSVSSHSSVSSVSSPPEEPNPNEAEEHRSTPSNDIRAPLLGGCFMVGCFIVAMFVLYADQYYGSLCRPKN